MAPTIISTMAQNGNDDGGTVILWSALGIALLIYFGFSLAKKLKKAPGEKKTAARKPLITAEDVVAVRFQPTKFREGYDQDQVDAFLDKLVLELRRVQEENERLQRQSVDPLSPPVLVSEPIMTVDQVVDAKFSPTKFRHGYDQDAVDDFLLKVIGGLQSWITENEQLRARISGNIIP